MTPSYLGERHTKIFEVLKRENSLLKELTALLRKLLLLLSDKSKDPKLIDKKKEDEIKIVAYRIEQIQASLNSQSNDFKGSVSSVIKDAIKQIKEDDNNNFSSNYISRDTVIYNRDSENSAHPLEQQKQQQNSHTSSRIL